MEYGIKYNLFRKILLLDKKYELKNRYTHIDYVQSAKDENLKCNFCTLVEQAIINLIKENPNIKQEEIVRKEFNN